MPKADGLATFEESMVQITPSIRGKALVSLPATSDGQLHRLTQVAGRDPGGQGSHAELHCSAACEQRSSGSNASTASSLCRSKGSW